MIVERQTVQRQIGPDAPTISVSQVEMLSSSSHHLITNASKRGKTAHAESLSRCNPDGEYGWAAGDPQRKQPTGALCSTIDTMCRC